MAGGGGGSRGFAREMQRAAWRFAPNLYKISEKRAYVMDDFHDVIDRIRDANPIEDVIADLGYKFEKEGGSYWRVPHEGGLVVNVARQRFFWVSKGWNGDVFSFLGKDKGWDFKAAVEWCADRAGLERPAWGKVDPQAMESHRLKLSVLEIAHLLFQKWLEEDKEALAYLKGRAFSEERIRAAAMGFSGRGKAEQVAEMKKQFDLFGIAHDCPQAVVILGFKGDVAAWADKWGIDRASKTNGWDRSWEEKGKIHGMMNTPGIIYAHQWGGRVIYLTRRNLPGHDVIQREDGSTKAWKSHNPQRVLMGMRQPYFNSAFRPDADDVVIVEGPADAETFAQWGIPAVALCGVSADDQGIGALKGMLKRNKRKFLLLDDDKAGNEKREKVAMAFGAMCRIVSWADLLPNESDAETEVEEASNGE